MSPFIFLIQVSRPIVWPFLPLVYYLGLHAAHAELTAAAIAQIVLLTFPMNLIGCGLNDIYDFESDRRCPRRHAIWGAVVRDVDRPLVLWACLAMMPLLVFGACITQNWDNIVATVCLLLVAWCYSVPPIRLKERPPLDSVANGLGFFLIPFTMGYSLGADPRGMPLKYYLLALAVCGVHALASAADYDADRDAGHRTIAVVYGPRIAAFLAFITFFMTWLMGDYGSDTVRVYIALCALAALAAAIVPRNSVIVVACGVIFVGFLIAATSHILAS
ncbi:MAG: UbiA family prenyltransferase [Pirellulales bacterium]